MKDLTPAAWDFLGDIARRHGKAEAARLRELMTDGTIAQLDGEPVTCEFARQFELGAAQQMQFDLVRGSP